MMSPEMKALIDRAGFVCRATPEALKYKVGAAVVVARRAGAMTTFDAINHFFLINQMIIPGSSYWNIGIGNKKGEVENDDRRHGNNGNPWQKHGMAAKENQSLTAL